MRRLRRGLVLVVVLVGAVAARGAWVMDDNSARRDDAAVARRAADLATGTATSIEASVSGATAVVRADGTVDEDAFRRFGAELTSTGLIPALALELVVLDRDRPAFERTHGPIVDRSEGEPVPAPHRPAYYPVLAVVPEDGPGANLGGFDIGGDPARAAAADEAATTGRPVFSEPVPSQPTGTLAFFLIEPLYDPGAPQATDAQRRGALAGFVSTVFSGQRLVETLAAQLPAGTRFEVRDGTQLLASSTQPLDGGVTVPVQAANRSWTVLVDGPSAPDHDLAFVIGLVTLLVAAGLALELRRAERHNRSTARQSALIAETADLTEALSGALTIEDVIAIIDERVPPLLGAGLVSLAVVDEEAGVLRYRHTGPSAARLASRQQIIDLDALSPSANAVREDRTVLVRSLADWRAMAPPDHVAEIVQAGVAAAVCIPLATATGKPDAALRVCWPEGIELEDDLVSTAATIAEVCGYAVDRARQTDEATLRATQLAELAARLTASTTVEEVAAAVTSQGRDPIDAAATSVGLVRDDHLVVHHGDSVPDPYRAGFATPRLDEPLGLTVTARTGETLLFADQAEYDARFPDAGGPAAGARAFLPLRTTDGRLLGVVGHLWRGPRAFEPALRSTMRTIADLTAQALERAQLMASRAEEARQAEELARLAEGLATRTSAEDVMAFLTRAVLPPLGAVHAAVAVRDGGLLQRFYTPGEKSDELRELLPDIVPLDAPNPLSVAARTGQVVLVNGIDDLRAVAPEMEDGWARLGFAATANLPLRDRAGTLIGSLGVAWDHPVRFDELRDRLATVAGIAGQTLERAQLVDRVRAQSQRDTSLARLAEAVATARSEPEVRDAIVAFAGPVVDATSVNLAVVDETTGTVAFHPEVITPAARALLDVALRSPDSPPAASAGRVDEAVVALRDSTGRRLGAVAMSWETGTDLDAEGWRALGSVADLCAQALERAQLSDAEHRVVSTLQASLLVPLAQTDRLSAAARYLPAAASVGMGGDWYEGVLLDDGRYLLVVGDVAGHGITAVGQMAELRSVLGAVAAMGTPLERVFDTAGGRGSGAELVVASAVILRIDAEAETIEYASAGHLPPLVRRPDGTVDVLSGGRRPLIGLRVPAGPPATAPFPRGSVLLCYTDGLIERRHEIIDESVARLATCLAGIASTDPEAVADEVLARCLESTNPTDDVALAVLTHTP